jgi:hypothetical protein
MGKEVLEDLIRREIVRRRLRFTEECREQEKRDAMPSYALAETFKYFSCCSIRRRLIPTG